MNLPGLTDFWNTAFNMAADANITKNQQLGSAKISQVQQRLTQVGFDTQGVDGQWGPNTQSAFIQFQQAASLPVDGVYGPESDTALFQDAPSPAPQPIAPAVVPATPGDPAVPSSPNSSTTTYLMVGGGALLVGVLLYMAKKKRGTR